VPSALDVIIVILATIIALVVGNALVVNVVQLDIVSGTSMLPTLHDGDKVVVNKLPSRDGNFNYGDIVAIRTVDGELLIKRVIAKAGDTVAIKRGRVYRNNLPLTERYIEGDFTETGNIDGEIIVRPGKVFVLGDNRLPDGSLDSRYLGQIDLSNVIGRALIKIHPLPIKWLPRK
jgi:signal peptidase I